LSAEALGDAPRLGRIEADISNAYYCLAEHELALEAGLRALAIGEAAHDPSMIALARHALAHAHRSKGDYRRAVDAATGTVGFLKGERAAFPDRYLVAARTELAVSLAQLGRFEEAIANVDEAARVAETIEHPWQAAMAATQRGQTLNLHGLIREAIASLERSLALCRSFDFRGMSIATAAYLGEAYALAGRADEALPLLREAIARASELGRIGDSSPRFAALGAAELATNDLDHAAEHAKQALDFAAQHGERGHEAWALRLCGEIGARTDLVEGGTAEEQYRRALALAEELGMRPLQAHCHLGLGKLYRRASRLYEARAELATAVAMLREMGMSFWLPEAEREAAL
jgi:tetratricopeptide (TPR) repeat protein